MVWTAPSTWLAGSVVTAAKLNEQLRDNLQAIGDPWTAYAPVWTAATTNPVIGNGTITGAYIQAGKFIVWRFAIISGTTTTYGSGNYSISLPVPGNSLFPLPVGDIIGLSSGAASFAGTLHATGSNTVVSATFNATRWSPAAPYTPAAATANNRWAGQGVYEAA